MDELVTSVARSVVQETGQPQKTLPLALTADERLWPATGPVAVLGEWCRVTASQEARARIARVLPYHWDDRGKLAADQELVRQTYEREFERLAAALNALHGVQRSIRYWRILIGPWLSAFVFVMLDRYRSLEAAMAEGLEPETLPRSDDLTWLPADTMDFHSWSGNDDAYNAVLYADILRAAWPQAAGRAGSVDIPGPARRGASSRPKGWKQVVAEMLERNARRIPSSLNRVVLVSSCLDPADQAKLQLSMGQVPYLMPPTLPTPPKRYDAAMRGRLRGDASGRGFDMVLQMLIPRHIPSLFVENFASFHRTAVAEMPKDPRVIFTAYAYEHNEGFKFWSADAAERGTRLVGMQHGSHYGAMKCFLEEEHQTRIYDVFYTWGWEGGVPGPTKVLNAAKFNRLLRRVTPAPRGRLLLALTAWPRYANKSVSAPTAAGQTLTHIEENLRYAEALDAEPRRQLLVRCFPNDRGWQQRERWKERLPDVEAYLGPKHMFEQMNESRLFVCVCNSTPHMEAFVADFPTLLLWNPAMFELRESARPIYEQLVEADILHETPESAARQTNAIFHDPSAWWRTPKVQAARNAFNHAFARHSASWLPEWRRELQEQARLARNA